MNLILPVAGESSRFPNMRPKWMLTHPSGKLMLLESVSGLNIQDFSKIYVVGLKKHEVQYQFSKGLRKAFQEYFPTSEIEIILLEDPTKSQPETVYKAISQAKIKGAICIKDCDNFFRIDAKPINFISFCDLEKNPNINASNKSYIEISEHGLINNIVEKKIISSYFCTGAYGFESADLYTKYYNKCKDIENLYISHIMYSMLLDTRAIVHIESKDYKDWGTLRDWRNYVGGYKTLLVDIDGVLVKNSSKYFEPTWGQSPGIQKNIECMNEHFDSGKCEIILTTARTEDFESETKKQLDTLGIKYHRILFGLMHAKRVVINDFSATNPYPSCSAINIKRDSEDLVKLLGAKKC